MLLFTEPTDTILACRNSRLGKAMEANGKLQRAIQATVSGERASHFEFRYVPHGVPSQSNTFSNPWDKIETRKGMVGGREVVHLHHFRQYCTMRLFRSSPAEVANYDIAEMNLICAYGLTGKHDIEIEAMLKVLDVWAKRCQTYITQKLSIYHADPTKFGSLAKFCIRSMVQVLTRQLGVRYNPLQAAEPSPNPPPITDTADSFIHGILGPQRTGTCATLPVVLTAVGRRLGYPLKLVLAPGHSFCRWDASDERFNIEYDQLGTQFHPDDYYRTWPMKWNQKLYERESKSPYFLTSLTPAQELASFIKSRAYHLTVAGKHRRQEAFTIMQAAHRLWPTYNVAVWTNHMMTLAMNPDRDFPLEPSEETSGKAAVERLNRKDNFFA